MIQIITKSIKFNPKKNMEKETIYQMMCPKCYQLDNLYLDDLKEYVLSDTRHFPRGDIPGQYPCPYGCDARMGLVSLITNETTDEERESINKMTVEFIKKSEYAQSKNLQLNYGI